MLELKYPYHRFGQDVYKRQRCFHVTRHIQYISRATDNACQYILSLIHILPVTIMAKTTMANAGAVRHGMLHSAKKVTGPIKKRTQKKEKLAVRNVATLKNEAPKMCIRDSYYLAYQLLFIFLATGTDATIALIGGADITANFRPGTMAISIGMLLLSLIHISRQCVP